MLIITPRMFGEFHQGAMTGKYVKGTDSISVNVSYMSDQTQALTMNSTTVTESGHILVENIHMSTKTGCCNKTDNSPATDYFDVLDHPNIGVEVQTRERKTSCWKD